MSDWAIWGALAFGVSAGIAALGLLVARVKELWRAFEETRELVVRGLDGVTAAGEATATRRRALEDAQFPLERVTAVVPRR
jgi:hypothetical protein